MVTIRRVEANEAAAYRADLIAVLQDAVDGGASVGFLAPLRYDEAGAFWDGVIAAVGSGSRILLIAEEGGALVGTAQLALEPRANSRHRAEVMKVLVFRHARQRGTGRTLMHAIEAEARRHGRTLLVLDTKQGEPAERLYQRLGYQTLGVLPRYAADPDGTLAACTFMYRELS